MSESGRSTPASSADKNADESEQGPSSEDGQGSEEHSEDESEPESRDEDEQESEAQSEDDQECDDQSVENEETNDDAELYGEPEDPPEEHIAESYHHLDTRELRGAIKGALDQIDGGANFSCFYTFNPFVDPRLCVGGSDRSAPFGLGADTVVDRSIRNTWEIDADKISMLNRHAFDESLTSALPCVLSGLGLHDHQTIRAELYKLLLYESGAFFRPHTDTEKTPGMFGTLTFCLPSEHQGGDIVLSHHGKTIRYSTASFNPSIAAWHSDVTHEVKPVVAGYRLVLTYNLVHEDPNIPPSSLRLDEHQSLGRMLNEWVSRPLEQAFVPLMYRLEHRYTDASISLATLKTKDLHRATIMHALSEREGFDVYLASMEREVNGEVESELPWFRDSHRGRGRYNGYDDRWRRGYREITTTHMESLNLKRVVDVNGIPVTIDVPITEDCMLDRDVFQEGRVPDREDFTPYTGNAGAEATHWYRDTVMIILRQDWAMKFFLTAYQPDSPQSNIILPLLNKQYSKVSADRSDRRARTDLLAICNFVLNKNKKYIEGGSHFMFFRKNGFFRDQTVGRVLEVFCGLGFVCDFSVVARAAVGELPLTAFRALSAVLQGGKFTRIQPGVEAVLGLRKTAGDRLAAIKQLLHPTARFIGPGRVVEDSAVTWAIGQAQAAAKDFVETTSYTTREDGAALAFAAVIHEKEAWVYETAACRVSENKTKTAFALAFLSTWIKDAPAAFSDQFTADVFMSLWRPISANLDFAQPSFTAPHHSHPRAVGRSAQGTVSAANEAISNDLAKILAFWLPRFTPDTRAFQRLVSRLVSASADAFHFIIVPALVDLIKTIDQTERARLEPGLGNLVNTLLNHYIQIYVQEQPANRINWSRPPVPCDCNVCNALNEFLVSHIQERLELTPRLSNSNRAHVHSMLETSRSDCSHESVGSGICRQLVVIKRNRSKQSHDSWSNRCREAYDQLKKFDQRVLKELLGNLYSPLMGMEAVISHDATAPEFLRIERAQQRAQHRITAARAGLKQQVVGQKRKANAIDDEDWVE